MAFPQTINPPTQNRQHKDTPRTNNYPPNRATAITTPTFERLRLMLPQKINKLLAERKTYRTTATNSAQATAPSPLDFGS